jgi:glyoxylase-like metal-dependent hydrolase (beta-lactamase superfamily II)
VKELLELKKKNNEVYPIVVPDSSSLKSINFYLIKTNQTVTLIDAGYNTGGCYMALVDTLHRNGFSLKDITDIILTHHHIDHVGLVNRIVSEHPNPVYVHPLSIPRLKRDTTFLEMRIEFFAKLYEQMGCGENGKKQVNYLKESIEKNKGNAIQTTLIPVGNRHIKDFEIIEVPGHAPDQIALYDHTRNWLFSGDLLLNHISSNALVEPDQNGERMLTLVDHMKSLKKCQNYSIHTVFPGHGSLIQQPSQLIQKRINGIEEKARNLMDLIQQGNSTANELAKTFYRKSYDNQFSLVMSEVIGHLDYLEAEGKVSKKIIDDVWHYSVSL